MLFWQTYGDAAKTGVGFFWKAGWAFVLGYWISAMIQVFVPKGRLTPYMGTFGLKSLSLATLFGGVSSSCSFAALAAARSLLVKGAHFTAAVAFMFASTNLVIELGILILIFLGWQFLAAEILGGFLLIAVSSALIRLTCPKNWISSAREKAKEGSGSEEEDFDWKRRIRSREGWNLVGHRFVSDWDMVWEEIVIGFTIAGFVAVLMPHALWESVFLIGTRNGIPEWARVLENVAVAPFVAAATFIGSMGNIPLATVLNSNGVLFAGIMGFIYSDLMVPPLVMINAKYYGWKVALYIAVVMYASIAATSLVLYYLFGFIGAVPQSGKRIEAIAPFALDYTFFLNLFFAAVAAGLVWLHRSRLRGSKSGMKHKADRGIGLKRLVALLFIAAQVLGIVVYFV